MTLPAIGLALALVSSSTSALSLEERLGRCCLGEQLRADRCVLDLAKARARLDARTPERIAATTPIPPPCPEPPVDWLPPILGGAAGLVVGVLLGVLISR